MRTMTMLRVLRLVRIFHALRVYPAMKVPWLLVKGPRESLFCPFRQTQTSAAISDRSLNCGCSSSLDVEIP